MLLLILVVSLVGLLLHTPELVGAAAVIYYVTPSHEPPNPDCPAPFSGDPCETLDHYASNVTGYFAGNDNVTMIFLSGNHTSKICFIFSCPSPSEPCLDLTMVGLRDDVEIHLGCDFTLSYVKILTMSNLTIHGNEKYGVILEEAPTIGMALNQVTFMGALLYFGGHLSSSVTLNNSHFEASLIEMESKSSNVNVSILQSTFITGSHQANTVSMYMIHDSVYVTLIINGVVVTSQSDIELQAPPPRYSNCTLSTPDSIVVADVSICLMTGRLDTHITNSSFSREHGMAFHYQLGTKAHDSILNVKFENASFQNYDNGAITLRFLTFAVRINVKFVYCSFENNSLTSTADSSSGSGASGVQIIYPLHGEADYTDVNHTVKFERCMFHRNIGQVVLLYKSKYITFVDCTFTENNGTGIVAFHTYHLRFSGQMKFLNNSAYRGSGLVLTESPLYIDHTTSITFYGNLASNKGGGILVEGHSVTAEDNPATIQHCFYQIKGKNGTQKFNFTANFASLGGHDIYGSPLASYCLAYYDPSDHQAIIIRSYEQLEANMFHFQSKTLSSITSDPQRVCICNDSYSPVCDDVDSIFLSGYTLYPGEVFNLSVAVVGVEFGTVAGVVQTNLVQPDGIVNPEYHPVFNVTKCTDLNFTVFHPSPSQVTMYLTIQNRYAPYYDKKIIMESITTYHENHNIIPSELLTVPIFVDITLLPCPPGFRLVGKHPKCDCYPQIAEFIVCSIVNGTGLVSRNRTVWIGIDNDNNNTIFSKSCPFEYCQFDQVVVDISTDTDSQCAFNRAGRLCGGCMEGYSLAIGSTHCLHCPNSSYFALVLFFIFAGLVLVLLIHILNLTITQGTINGIVLYANIIWTYEEVLFPRRDMLILPLRIFLAWLNLDFGIESCFVRGLSAFWSSWLQFIFPLYIWSIAVVIILMCRHSTRFTKMFGDRAVPLLATLSLMSYLKLLRTIVDICLYTTLTVYPSESKIVIWYLDGNLLYGRYPHIFLLLVAIATFMLVYVPYTVVMFFIQWLRRFSHLRLLKWISKFNPVFDAHLAPLKDKHQYWFGVLLILRGVLLVIFTLTSADYPETNLLILFITTTTLFFYAMYFQFYKSKVTLLLEGLSLMNLILVAGCSLYVVAVHGDQSALINVSVSIMVVQFSAVIVWHCVQICCLKSMQRRGYLNVETVPESDVNTRQVNAKADDFDETDELRDSVLISKTY